MNSLKMVGYCHIKARLKSRRFLGTFTNSYRFMRASVLFLLLIAGCSTESSTNVRFSNERPAVSANNSPTARESPVNSPNVQEQNSKTLDCDDPKSYSVEEGTNSVNIVRGATVLQTIKLLTDIEQNGFAFDGAKKNKDGFEMSIEYGSVIFYHKTFIFTCREHKLYLNKIRVDSFNRHNPEKWSKKVVNVQPNLPLEKFSITDFMLEGAVKH